MFVWKDENKLKESDCDSLLKPIDHYSTSATGTFQKKQNEF